MKILVLDDSLVNRKSARATLGDHELIVVGTFDEAQEALTVRCDWELRDRIAAPLLVAAGFAADANPWRFKDDPDRQRRCEEIRDEAAEQATTHPDFDAVLLDLMVPASRQTMGREGMVFAGQERELGAILALRALFVGVRNVAVVTDMNHHDHPASAAFDGFGACQREGFNLLCTNRPNFARLDCKTGELVSDEFLYSEAGAAKYPTQSKYGQDCGPWEGIESGKDWGNILNRLLGQDND